MNQPETTQVSIDQQPSSARRNQVVVLAAGKAERFGDPDSPKHLVQVSGEPLLSRLVRLWRSEFPNVVVVVPPDQIERYAAAVGVNGTCVPRRQQPSANSVKYLEALECWDGESDLLIVFGDIFFTAEAVTRIRALNEREPSLRFFCRFGPSAITGTPWGEQLAISVPADEIPRFREVVLTIKSAFDEGRVHRDYSWEMAKMYAGVPFDKMQRHDWNDFYYDIDDLTDDIDFQDDFARLQSLVPQDLDDAIERISRLLSFTSQVLLRFTNVSDAKMAHEYMATAIQSSSSKGLPQTLSQPPRGLRRFIVTVKRGAPRAKRKVFRIVGLGG